MRAEALYLLELAERRLKLEGDVNTAIVAMESADARLATINDPAVRVAFFALRHDQDLATPIRLFARDEAGNTSRADFDFRVFPKPFKKSRIEVTDSLIDRVVPAILEGTTEIKPEGDNLAKFLAINSELRQKNADKIASFAAQTAPVRLSASTRIERNLQSVKVRPFSPTRSWQ